jgi:phosphate transport system substrate-binding protein
MRKSRALACCALTSLLLACMPERAPSRPPVSGELTIPGASPIFPLARAVSIDFMALHPDAKIVVQETSSGDGLKKLIAGEVMMASSTRPPTAAEHAAAKEKGRELYLTVIANDAVVLAVHPSSTLTNLTPQQIQDIYFTGAIKDWSQIEGSGKTGPIQPFGADPKSSGAADFFIEAVTGKRGTPYAAQVKVLPSVRHVLGAISNEPSALGTVSLGTVDAQVKMLAVDGVVASERTVLDVSYPYRLKLYEVTNGTPRGLDRELIDFFLSKKGQTVAREKGFVPVALEERG